MFRINYTAKSGIYSAHLALSIHIPLKKDKEGGVLELDWFEFGAIL